MTYRSSPNPGTNIGPQVDRPASASTDGEVYVSPTAISFWDVLFNGWRTFTSGGGGGSVGFVVGPAGSGAPYSTFAAAIAAAQFAGVNTVMFLSGSYVESFTLPPNMAIEPFGAEVFTAEITGNIFTNATSGIQSFRGFYLNGSLICGPLGGPATTAIITLTDMKGAPGAAPGIALLNDGWSFVMTETELDARSVPGNKAFSGDGTFNLEATRCAFKSAAQTPFAIGNGGNVRFVDCELNGDPVRITGAPANVTFVNPIFNLTGGPLWVIQGFAGSTVGIEGTFIQQGLAAAGTILSAGGGALYIGMGVNLGQLQFASRPTGGTITQGVSAYFSGMAPGGPNLTIEAPVYYAAGFWRRTSDDSVAV